MLSRDCRLHLTEIACRVRLGRKTTLEERIWMHKLIECNIHARNLVSNIIYPYINILE